jgi:hypothetical protein
MPFINKTEIYYEDNFHVSQKKLKDYEKIKADIFYLYVKNLESKIYPYDLIYPTKIE